MTEQSGYPLKDFALVWLGQSVSQLGSGITAFAISVWLYQETSSVTLFALNAFIKFLPGIVLSPLAGMWADQWPRRRIMLLADSGAALCTLFVAFMFFSGDLSVWHVYLVTAVIGLFDTFQAPAYQAAVTTLVSPTQLTRMGALLQLSGQANGLLAPPLAALLLARIGLPGILLIDGITFVCAVTTLMLVRFPALKTAVLPPEKDRPSWLDTAAQGWYFVIKRPALRGLLFLSGINLFLIAVNATLSIPLLLTLTSLTGVGNIALLLGGASTLSSAVIAAWGGPKRLMRTIFMAHIVVGLGLIGFGLRPNLALMLPSVLGIALILPLRDSVTGALWRSIVPDELQGRVFGLLQVVGTAAFGLAYLLVGPLADALFEPLMAAGGSWADSAGRLLGVGQGRGMGLCVVLAGLVTLVVTVLSYLNPHLRRIETRHIQSA